MLLEVVVVWLVVSPVVGVALGLFIARAALLADRRELRRVAQVAARPVEQPVERSVTPVAAVPAEQALEQPVEQPVGQPAGHAVVDAGAQHPALKLVTDVPEPRPVPSLDGVLHLRLTGPER